MSRPAGIGSAPTSVAGLREVPGRALEPVQAAPSCVVDRLEDARERPRNPRLTCAASLALLPVAEVASAPATPTFNPTILRAALTAEPSGPGHQAVVRDQLRLLIGKYGAADRDVADGLPRAAHYKVERLLPFNGAHLHNGLIQMSPKSHSEALRFLNGARDRSAITGMGSLVHEGLHGHSPAGANLGYLDEEAKRIDHLAVATAAQAIVVREFRVPPESVVTDVPYGVNETIDVVARQTGQSRAAARNALYDAALRYFAPGAELGTEQQVEQHFVDVVSTATGKSFDAALRRQLRNLPRL